MAILNANHNYSQSVHWTTPLSFLYETLGRCNRISSVYEFPLSIRIASIDLKDVHIARLIEPSELTGTVRHIMENEAIDGTTIEVTGGLTFGPRSRVK